MSEKVTCLSWGEAFDCTVRLFDTIHKVSCECMSEAVQTLLFNACRFKYSVIPLSKVARFRVIALTVADQGCILSEVKLCSELFYGFNSGVVKRYCSLARSSLRLANLYLSARFKLYPIPFLNLFHSLVNVQNSVLKVDVTVKQTEKFSSPQPCVQHKDVCR